MDQNIVASFRRTFEGKSTAELRQAYESSEKAAKSPEELEALRQLLDERRTKSNKAAVALGSAAVLGSLGGGIAWWQGADEVFVILAGVVCAILGFALWYIPDLIPRV